MPRHYLWPHTGFDIAGFMRHLSAWYFFFFPRRFILYYMPSWLILRKWLQLFLFSWFVRIRDGLFVPLQLHALPRW